MAKRRDVPATAPPSTPVLTVVAWPGVDVPTLLGDPYVIGRSRRFASQSSTFDAVDHRLARAGLQVEVEGGQWSVRCGDLGVRTFEADGNEPPKELMDALSGVARGAPLELAVRVRRSGRSAPVLAPGENDDGSDASDRVAPVEVGRLVDEDVSVLDGRRVVSRQRYLVFEGAEDLVAHVRRRLGVLRAADRLISQDSDRSPLGPPDPIPWAVDDRPEATTVVQRALARSVARLLAHDPVVRLDLHVEGVHQMRVATRRLRSDLRTFADLLDDLPEGLVEDLAWLATALGEVRDPDVLRERLVQVIEDLDPQDRRMTTSLVKRLVRQRDAALDRLHALLDTTRYHSLVTRLVALAEDPPFGAAAHQPATTALRPLAQRTWRRLGKAAKAARRPGAPIEDVHAMRIRAKRFRYALDVLADVEPAAKAHADRLADLQDVLGDLNDAAVAESWLRQTAAHEDDPRRMFAIGQLVMTQRVEVEQGRAKWPKVWKPVSRRKRRAWLER